MIASSNDHSAVLLVARFLSGNTFELSILPCLALRRELQHSCHLICVPCGDCAQVDEIASAVRASAPSKEAAAEHWAVRASRGLSLASPTSLAVTLEGLRRGEGLASLGQCLAMEYRVAQRFLKHPDFLEGVGSVLRLRGDGGQQPSQPKWAAAPTADEVAAFFEPVEGGELELE
eukprot:COSAG06_NODE_4_length_41837_cov_204.557597_23_plen_175_part_00